MCGNFEAEHITRRGGVARGHIAVTMHLTKACAESVNRDSDATVLMMHQQWSHR